MYSLILILTSISSLISAELKNEYIDMINVDKEPFYEFKKNKYYIADHISNNIQIDGKLDEDFWFDFDSSSSEGNYISSFLQESPKNMIDPSFKTFVKIGYDSFKQRLKSGFPEKSSPSIQTFPASIAIRSVSEITGKNCKAFKVFAMGIERRKRRIIEIFKITETAIKTYKTVCEGS